MRSRLPAIQLCYLRPERDEKYVHFQQLLEMVIDSRKILEMLSVTYMFLIQLEQSPGVMPE